MFPPHRYYYLHNFQRALAWVAERYDDVLDEPQRRFVADYAALPQPSQALLARLLLRRGPWFRASGLIYENRPGRDGRRAAGGAGLAGPGRGHDAG